MMEPVELPEFLDLSSLEKHEKWAHNEYGMKAKKITSFDIDPYELEKMNHRYQENYRKITKHEIRVEEYMMEDADITLVAYGTMARILKTVIKSAREKGIKAGLVRPVSLWPFPARAIEEAAKKSRLMMVYEMSEGQMVEDVLLSAKNQVKTAFYGRSGGVVPTPSECFEALKKELEGLK